MKLRLTFNPVVIKKIIIILLAILIASITTSFSFNLKKAYGETPKETLVKQLKDKKAEIEKIQKSVSDILALSTNPSEGELGVLVAELKRFEEVLPSRELSELIKMFSEESFTFDKSAKRFLTYYLGTLIRENEINDHEIQKFEGDAVKKACDPEDPNSPCALKSELLEQITALKKVLEAKDVETASLKGKVTELEKSNKAFTEKMGKLETDMFQTIVQLQTQITLASSSPEQIVTQYHELSQKFMGLFQMVRSVKVAIDQMSERIEEINAELTKEDLDQAKRDKLEKELKQLTAEREKTVKALDQLEKTFAVQKAMITAFRAHMEQNHIDPQISGMQRGTRVMGPDGQVVIQERAQDWGVQPQVQTQGLTQDEIIRNIVMQQVFGIQRSVNNFNQGISANVPPAQMQPMQPIPQANRQAGNRGSSSITTGNAPRGNSLMDLIQF